MITLSIVGIVLLVLLRRVILAVVRFGAPVAAAVGFLIVFVAVHVDSFRAFGFGIGLFSFATLLFVLAGGARGIVGS